jgi:hypothetical protein
MEILLTPSASSSVSKTSLSTASSPLSLSTIQALDNLSGVLLQETCAACGYHVAVPFYDGGKQPLTTCWPRWLD